MDEQNGSAGRSNGRSNGSSDGDGLVDAFRGAIAGAVGVWAMDQITWYMWDREDPALIAQELRARPKGLNPAHFIAEEAAEAMGKELHPAQRNPAGIAVHYALGILPGALYGVLRKRVDKVGAGAGALYGLGLFLMQDEGLNTLLGTAGPPTAYPWQAHVRGLAGHLTLGLATNAALDLLERPV